jgi:ribosomal protein S18 acetylase RimI-like enzyme
MRIRKATAADSPRCAEVHTLARQSMRYLPLLHAPAEVSAWMHDVVIARQCVWVAEIDGRIVGYAALGGGMLTHLYVEPGSQRRGLGTALLAWIKAAVPGGFSLWTFQPNLEAIRFYERHGFRTVRETDGSANEERVPDQLMHWQPENSPGRVGGESVEC